MRPSHVLVLAALLGACKSHEPAPVATGSGSAVAAQPPPTTAGSAAPKGRDSVDAWDEDVEYPQLSPRPAHDHVFRVPATPPTAEDGDATIARYEHECPAGPTTKPCEDLRVQVERVLLDDMLSLRGAGQKLDPEWYRVAARAQTPLLACIGLRELARATTRTPEDEAALAAALDSPWPQLRETVLDLATTLPAIVEKRARAFRAKGIGRDCIGGLRDPTPGAKWAGNYPGAKFAYLTSSPNLRWFTTTDSIDKVMAYFAKTGRPPLTATELSAAERQRMIEETQRLAAAAPSSDEQMSEAETRKLIQHMAAFAPIDWTLPFHGIEGAGEIRYVKIAPRQAIAIFKDDVLHATSIVAARPPGVPSTDGQVEAVQRDAQLRAILRY